MVNWQDSTTIELQHQALVRFAHAVIGLYIWEWITTLHFDWSLFTGQTRWKWPMGVYLTCRYAALFCGICELVFFNLTVEFNCVTLGGIILILGYMVLELSSILITLRAIAIWQRNKYVMAIMILLLLVNAAFLIHGVTEVHTEWDPSDLSCATLDSSRSRPNVIITLCCDAALLTVMLIGIFLQRQPGGLWKILYYQGIVWAILATLAYVSTTVLLCLNFNDPMNLMFQTFAYITIATCATRLHRGLTEYAQDSSSGGSTTKNGVSTLRFSPNSRRSHVSQTTAAISIDELALDAPGTEKANITSPVMEQGEMV